MVNQLNIPGVPFPLEASDAGRWRLDDATGAVSATAAPRSDIFIDPRSGEATLNGTTLLGDPPEGDFRFSARVTVDFAGTFDAGVLLLWVDDRRWAKLCFEFSPDDEPMVVSVVCRGVADDANSFVVPERTVWLRVSRVDRAYAYHASADGETWAMIRHFAIDDGPVRDRIGFLAQAPTGDGCDVTFDEIRFTAGRLTELRDGS